MSGPRTLSVFVLLAALASSSCQQSNAPGPSDPKERLAALVLPEKRKPPKDVTNKYADDPAAAALGKKFFYDPRFSGPLLDDVNKGMPGNLGKQGEAGKVACASCHVASSTAFVDTRSPRAQLSLASGWTHRRTPSLLDVAQTTFLMWDGRRDTAYSQVFGPIESPLEFNSSRLFVAQQIARLYRTEYEAVFGPMPALDGFPVLEPTQAGCTEMPEEAATTVCELPGHEDEAVTRVVTNFGKAIQAFTRTLTCGPSRFDAWMNGDESALTPDEQAGALLFVTKGACDTCHSGPYLTDQQFHNLGVPGGLVLFTGVDTAKDPGASIALAQVKTDWLNSRGPFSDGDDDRLDKIPADLSRLEGAFKTPSLRCVSRRPAFMHNGEYRTLENVVAFFSDGPVEHTYAGTPTNYARALTEPEQAQLVAFLKALDGTGPDPAQLQAPVLPP